ncbi:6-bladed beta-propeller [Cyclobacterium marinum]|uniref:6-bladed beta-propeller n=1 Tax=Cyclobacterium marinum TaxID=104 RepID=UPI0011ED739C|nr:6-bladed beta-propeller [Cyclobacterium marinum]MBI0399500.1 6-bladed beta-propeller [Cyclobacterium marinum]
MVSRKVMVIVFFALGLFNACQDKEGIEQAGGLQIIRIEHDNQTELFLEDVAANYTSIPLEMTEESLIGYIDNIAVSENFIYVNHAKGILQFNHAGKYIKNIGENGEAPGNYRQVRSMIIDPADQSIVVTDYVLRKSLKFNENGKLLAESESLSSPPIFIASIPEGYVIITDDIIKDENSSILSINNFFIQDREFVKLDSLKPIMSKVERFGGSIWRHPSFITRSDSINFLFFPIGPFNEQIERDTLFQINQNGDFIPHLKFQFSENVINEEGKRVFFIEKMEVNEAYYLVTYHYEGNYYLFGYDRKKGNSWLVKDGLRVKNLEGYYLPKSNGISYLMTEGVSEIKGEEPNPMIHLIDWGK